MCYFRGGPKIEGTPKKGRPEATASFASPNIHHWVQDWFYQSNGVRGKKWIEKHLFKSIGITITYQSLINFLVRANQKICIQYTYL